MKSWKVFLVSGQRLWWTPSRAFPLVAASNSMPCFGSLFKLLRSCWLETSEKQHKSSAWRRMQRVMIQSLLSSSYPFLNILILRHGYAAVFHNTICSQLPISTCTVLYRNSFLHLVTTRQFLTIYISVTVLLATYPNKRTRPPRKTNEAGWSTHGRLQYCQQSMQIFNNVRPALGFPFQRECFSESP